MRISMKSHLVRPTDHNLGQTLMMVLTFYPASVAFFFLYYVFFGIGWQGVPWLYPCEINSLGMRTKGAGLGTSVMIPCSDQPHS